jgi:MraZ protein
MFLGEFQHTVDDKGRIVLPARFRDELADGCVLTKGQENCVYVFTLEDWEAEAQRMRALPRTDRRLRLYNRTFFSSSEIQKLDKQGRVTITAPLREYASLGKEVTVIGVADRIEIWNPQQWAEESAAADEEFANVEEAFIEYGI